jgi:predicted ATPase
VQGKSHHPQDPNGALRFAGRSTAAPGDATFVGRAAELGVLDCRLEAAAEGNGQIVILTGEGGIGKTRLIDELRGRARNRGAVVLAGRCEEGAAGGAYAAFGAALRHYVEEAGEDTLRTQLGANAGVLAPLVPGIRKRLVDVAEPSRLQPDEERTRLLDAMSQFLIAIAARAPLVLALDDLHWADDDTLALALPPHRSADRGTPRPPAGGVPRA